MSAGSVQTRQVPSGPVIVPLLDRPPVAAIEGQSAAGVTVPVPGVGVGLGVGEGLLMTMPPPPGEEMSSAPQPARASALQPIRSRPEIFFTLIPPFVQDGRGGESTIVDGAFRIRG